MLTNLKDKVCIVTGANSGMGKIIALALAKLEARLIMVCRVREKAQIAYEEIKSKSKNQNIELMLTDLSSQKEIRILAENIKEKYKTVDVLINNAGCMNFKYSETPEAIETTFATNHLGYFLLTNLLLKNLSPSARIINVASEASKTATINFDDLNLKDDYSSFKAYSQSKLANIMFTYELSRLLREKGSKITVNCVHPGIVPDTKLGKGSKVFASFISSLPKDLLITPEQGAETTIWLAVSDEVKDLTGKYFYNKKEIQSSPISYDLEMQKRLWVISSGLVNLDSV
jgi:NAD(P)-dependent dehydrogenase (short-subunit alcohol dehydrogenase family)